MKGRTVIEMVMREHIDQFRAIIDGVSPLGDSCWSELIPVLYSRDLEKNEYFSKEGQYTKEYGFICQGVMRLFYLSEDGNEWNKYFFVENDFVAASIDPERESITRIQALTPVSLVCIPAEKFTELSDRFEQFRAFFQKMIFDYLDEKQDREIRFLSNEALDNYLYFQTKFPGLEDRIAHYHIASYLGITPTQLARVRKKLKNNENDQHM